jgi:hypothetical protein
MGAVRRTGDSATRPIGVDINHKGVHKGMISLTDARTGSLGSTVVRACT